MDSAKQQLIDKLKTANNILVTVSRNPSVDQLASCIGLTLLLNKQGKHAAAVFSGDVPSTLEFLQPEETIEKNTDSLRDFIIALDKSKADKLRYKIEDNVVRIFITPYKTSISEADLEFSEGDFNVDVVVALGVLNQEDLDEAITAHGRILHDAAVASINTSGDGGLGTIDWREPQASSLSELVTELAKGLGDNLLDTQIATALLTGIVSETARFSNDKTSSQTMSASATLMAAGANQQLVASKLEEPASAPLNGSDSSGDGAPADGQSAQDDGTIEINHYDDGASDQDSAADSPPSTDAADEQPDLQLPAPDISDLPQPPMEMPAMASPINSSSNTNLSPGSRLMTEPPTMGGALTANTSEETLETANDPLGLPTVEPPQLLDRQDTSLPPTTDLSPSPRAAPITTPTFTPPPSSWTPTPTPVPPSEPLTPPSGQPSDAGDRTLTALESSVVSPHVVNEPLTDLEKSVGSSHVADSGGGLDVVRDEVNRALNDSASTETPMPEPIQALNSQPLGDDIHPAAADPAAVPEPEVTDPNAPPPVPPPIPFQFGNPPPSQ